jgi:tetratricopeptide (TPR) repeat protein
LTQNFPDNVIGFNGLAKLAMQTQQWELAKSRWQIAIKRFSQSAPNVPGYIGKIKAAIELKEWEIAETTLQQIIDRQDNLEAIFIILVKLAFYTNSWKLVLKKLDILIENNIYLILNLDRQNTIYYKIGNLIKHLVESERIILAKLVIKKLEDKITEDSDFPILIAIWKSSIAQAKAEYDLADLLCRELIDRQSNNAINLHFQRLKNYWQQNDFQRTLQLSEEFTITQETKHSELKIIYQALRIKSEALIKLEKIEAAKNQLEQLIKLLPTQHQAYLLLIEIFYFHDCNYQKALDIANLAIDNGVWQRQLIFYRALALSTLGKTIEALITIDRYLTTIPTDKLAMIYRSQILRDNHQYRDALAQLNQILIAGGYTPLKSTSEQYELTISHLQSQSETQIEATTMVSIIMTVYQRNQWLEIAIDSILQQTYRHLELIIVDDASTDDTWEWLQQIAITDNRIRLLKMTTNVGTYVAKNQGMLFSQGYYIAFMDADDWIHPQKLEAQIKILENSDAIAVTSSYLRVQTNSDLEFMPEKPMRQGCITLCFKKQPVLKQVGFFDAVRSMADSEYESRIKIVFGIHSIKLIEEPLLISMRHENSITGGGWQLTKISWHGNQLSQFPYIAAYKAWHGYLKSNPHHAYLPHSLDCRPFNSPEHLLSCASSSLSSIH